MFVCLFVCVPECPLEQLVVGGQLRDGHDARVQLMVAGERCAHCLPLHAEVLVKEARLANEPAAGERHVEIEWRKKVRARVARGHHQQVVGVRVAVRS